MNLTMFGTGYVGLVTGACMADVGHRVVCLDIDAEKIAHLNAGDIPIHEPGLEAIVQRNLAAGTLQFTTDPDAAIAHSDIYFIAVGTPPDESGAADLQHVLSVARLIGSKIDRDKIVVVKSTVPVGTSDQVRSTIATMLDVRGVAPKFDVVSNPEFLKEGAAVNDFLKPDRIIIGAASEQSRALMKELYEPFNRSHDRMIYMDIRSAELTKYAANAMLATKISFINEMANLAEILGADIEDVRRGIGADPRIGYHFIYPGLGYGGSCFPKDIKAIGHIAASHDYDAPLVAAVETVNQRQKQVLLQKIVRHFGGDTALGGKRFAIWGLAFKPNTDDMREAPSRLVIETLLAHGANIAAFDPVAHKEARRLYGHHPNLAFASDQYSALEGADALIICTEWQQFRAPDFSAMGEKLKEKLIFDGRNLYTPSRLAADGWTYHSIGRAVAAPEPDA